MLRLFLAIGGPIFAKESVETARRKRYFVNRVLYGLTLLVALALVWKSANLHQGPITIHMAARFAREIFVAVSLVQYAAVWFFVPVFVCGLIAAEREAQTLDLLLTARLNDRDIVLGKLVSRWAVVAQMTLSTLPVICIVGMFGGIDARAVWRTLNSTLLAMVVAGAFSIYFSSASRSPVGSLVRTYWWLAVWLLGVPFLTVLVVQLLRPRPSPPPIFLGQVFINPIAPFLGSIEPVFDRQLRGMFGGWYNYWALYVLPLAVSAILTWRAVVRLRLDPSRLLVARFAAWGMRTFGGALLRRREKRLAQRAVRAERWSWFMPVANPLWLRARLARVYDREGHIGRVQLLGWLAAVAVFLFVAVVEPRDLHDHGAAILFLAPTWIALGLLTTILAASSIVNDRRRGFFDLVLVTTLEVSEIIDGTLLAVWQHVRRTWWLAAALTGVFVLTGAVAPQIAFVSLASGTLFCATIVTAGVMTSLAARSMPQALVPTFALSLVVTIGTGLLIAFFHAAAGPIAWVMAIILLPTTFIWTQRSLSAAAVGTHFIAVHLAMVLLASALSFDTRNEALPLGLCNPAPMTIGVLSEKHNVGDLFVSYPSRRVSGRSVSYRNHPGFDASRFILAYWVAMVANIVWGRRWMITRFDRMTGRVQRRRRDESPPMFARQLPATQQVRQ
jgi:ABC-type transport system involved in multi-copper enzyme maturation permease subunit